jgi:hypothetical protein
MCFPTKVDRWMGCILVAIPLVFVGQLVFGLTTQNTGLIPVDYIGAGSLAVLYWVFVWPLNYTVGDDAIVARFGLIRVRIPYDIIESVAPHRGIMNGLALSSDRLQIKRRGKLAVQISPKDKAGFLAALAEKGSGLELKGDRVERVQTAAPDA